MSVHDRNELRRVNRRVRANTRASLMSDSKWRKMLVALDRPGLELRQCVVKFVGGAEPRIMRLPKGLHPPRPWIDTVEFGPIPLRAIEWMWFPAAIELPPTHGALSARRIEQDVEAAFHIVGALGKYPAELSERGLLIVGHLANSSPEPVPDGSR